MRSKTLLCRLLTATVIAGFLSLSAGAQEASSSSHNVYNAGFRVYSSVSASGHGLFLSPSLYVRMNRSLLSGGFIVNASSNGKGVEGLSGSYEYALVGDCGKMPLEHRNERLEFFAFASVMYRPSSRLAETTLACERQDPEMPQLKDLKLETYEAYTGIGLKIKFLEHFQWANSLGVGAYYSPNCPRDMYHNYTSMGLILRTGLYVNLR